MLQPKHNDLKITVNVTVNKTPSCFIVCSSQSICILKRSMQRHVKTVFRERERDWMNKKRFVPFLQIKIKCSILCCFAYLHLVDRSQFPFSFFSSYLIAPHSLYVTGFTHISESETWIVLLILISTHSLTALPLHIA